jgi:nucleotide-binding universal stress UspA family protein
MQAARDGPRWGFPFLSEVAMNDIKTLLLHWDASATCPHRLAAAQPLAQALGARLEMLYAVTPIVELYPVYALEASGAAGGQLAAWDTELRDSAQQAFTAACQASGAAELAWRVGRGDPVRALVAAGWAADLLVLGQQDAQARDAAGVSAEFVADVLESSGKPCLVLPYIPAPAQIGHNVLVAWKARPESARALTAALPLLQRARSVHLVCWDESGEDGDALHAAVQYLQAHGVAPVLHREGQATGDVGELLLSLAADLQVDLLVMGCYGHGRTREWVLGGVTRTLLRAMTVPVLMVH